MSFSAIVFKVSVTSLLAARIGSITENFCNFESQCINEEIIHLCYKWEISITIEMFKISIIITANMQTTALNTLMFFLVFLLLRRPSVPKKLQPKSLF